MFSGIDLSPTHDLAGRWTCGIVLEDFGVHQVAAVVVAMGHQLLVAGEEERWNCWALVVVVVE